MRNKKAKMLRKTAKAIYGGKTEYDDVFRSVEEKIEDDTGVVDNPYYFMHGALYSRKMKHGSARRMFKELKAGTKSKLVTVATPEPFYTSRKYRKRWDIV